MNEDRKNIIYLLARLGSLLLFCFLCRNTKGILQVFSRGTSDFGSYKVDKKVRQLDNDYDKLRDIVNKL